MKREQKKNIENIEKLIQEKKKIPKNVKDKINARVFENMVFAAIILVYIVALNIGMENIPTDTYIIKEGTLSQEETEIGYVIRNEIVKKGQNEGNGIYVIASEGEKVAYNDPIFRYYSSTEKEISKEINEIDYQIQELLEKEKKITSADIKSIENQIESEISNINKLSN